MAHVDRTGCSAVQVDDNPGGSKGVWTLHKAGLARSHNHRNSEALKGQMQRTRKWNLEAPTFTPGKWWIVSQNDQQNNGRLYSSDHCGGHQGRDDIDMSGKECDGESELFDNVDTSEHQQCETNNVFLCSSRVDTALQGIVDDTELYWGHCSGMAKNVIKCAGHKDSNFVLGCSNCNFTDLTSNNGLFSHNIDQDDVFTMDVFLSEGLRPRCVYFPVKNTKMLGF